METNWDRWRASAEAACRAGNYAQAENLWVSAIQEARHWNWKDKEAYSLDNLADVFFCLRRYTDAEGAYRQALAIKEQLRVDPLQIAVSLNRLADIYYVLSNYSQAEAFLKRVLSIYETAYGSEHIDIGRINSNLATLYHREEKFDEAETCYKRALSLKEKFLGKDHAEVTQLRQNYAQMGADRHSRAVPSSYSVVGQVAAQQATPAQKTLQDQIASQLSQMETKWETYRQTAEEAVHKGDYPTAEKIWYGALQEAQYCGWHDRVVVTLDNLADVYFCQHKYDDAEKSYRRALELREESLGKEHLLVGRCLNRLANLFYVKGDYMEAGKTCTRALKIHESSLGRDHPDVGSILSNMAVLFHWQGKFFDASSAYERAIEIKVKELGAGNPEVLRLKEALEGMNNDPKNNMARIHKDVQNTVNIVLKCLSQNPNQFTKARHLLQEEVAVQRMEYEQEFGLNSKEYTDYLQQVTNRLNVQGLVARLASNWTYTRLPKVEQGSDETLDLLDQAMLDSLKKASPTGA